LRSPLNAILGFAQLMESDSPPPTPAQSESIAQILQGGWHLLTLISEILDLAKVESGKVPLTAEPVPLAEVLLECQAMIEPQAQQRDIKLNFPKLDIPYVARADTDSCEAGSDQPAFQRDQIQPCARIGRSDVPHQYGEPLAYQCAR